MSIDAAAGGLQRRLHQLFDGAASARAIGGIQKMAVGTTAGPFREENEDRVAVARFEYSNGVTARAAIICDGMGGLVYGEEAASEAIATFLSAVATAPREASLPNILEEAVQFANKTIFEAYRGDGGTTLTAVLATHSEGWMVHVGDSRLYGFDFDTGLELLTRDDTIQGMVVAHHGGGDEDDLDNRLLQYVGVGDTMHPQVVQLDLVRHKFWILTSDGAHVIGRKMLGGISRTGRDPADIVRKIVYVAEAVGTEDNASAACMEVMSHREQRDSFGGTNISFWSPSEKLEIWLPQLMAASARPIANVGRQATKPNLAASRSTPAPQPRPGEKKSSTKKRKKSEGRKPRDSDAQMEVIFAPKQSPDD